MTKQPLAYGRLPRHFFRAGLHMPFQAQTGEEWINKASPKTATGCGSLQDFPDAPDAFDGKPRSLDKSGTQI